MKEMFNKFFQSIGFNIALSIIVIFAPLLISNMHFASDEIGQNTTIFAMSLWFLLGLLFIYLGETAILQQDKQLKYVDLLARIAFGSVLIGIIDKTITPYAPKEFYQVLIYSFIIINMLPPLVFLYCALRKRAIPSRYMITSFILMTVVVVFYPQYMTLEEMVQLFYGSATIIVMAPLVLLVIGVTLYITFIFLIAGIGSGRSSVSSNCNNREYEERHYERMLEIEQRRDREKQGKY
jgi:hypothetical protein